METNEEMKLASLLSRVIVTEVSQKLIKQLMDKFLSQTTDGEKIITTLINKFEDYKQGLAVEKRDITKYSYDELKSLILSKEMDKQASKSITKLKQKWDKLRENLPEEQSGPYRYQDSVLRSLAAKFYDMYPYINEKNRDIMKYDFLTLTEFINQNYGKVMNKVITNKMSKDPTFIEMGSNPDTLLFYIQSYIQNRDRVPRGTKPVGMMTFQELEQLVDGALSQTDEGAEKYKEDFSDIDRVYEKNNLIIFSPKSKDQCVRLKNGRTWCTSREGGGNLYYNYRLGNERTLYYVIDQDKPFNDLNYAVVILVDPYGNKSMADGSNSGKFSGHNNLPWSEIEEKVPKLKGLESMFKPIPLTEEERELIQKVRGARVGDDPYESLGDEKTVEMWLEYNSPTLNNEQYIRLSPELKKKYISLGFNLTGKQLQNSPEGVISHYINKKKEKLANTSLDSLTDEDVALLRLPMMKNLKEKLKTNFAQSFLKGTTKDGKFVLRYPSDTTSKYVALYGFDELFESIPEDITTMEITVTSNSNFDMKIPSSISRFKNLTTIHFENFLDEIPEELSQFKNLMYLSLPNNKNLKKIPEFIADLPELTMFNITGSNPNIEVPKKILDKAEDPNTELHFFM
jgi:hypothetical protein